jgi:transketolase
MRDNFIATLLKLVESNPNIILITGDLGFGVLDEFIKKYPDNFINAGVAEQNMMGIATGLAMEGKIVFTYSIANFPTLRCLEQIRNDACYHEANVKIISIGGGFSYGALGISHHATEDLAILRSLPNITVICPSGKWEVINATKQIYNHPGTCYLRIDKSMGNDNPSNEMEEFNIGKGRVLYDGHDCTIIVTGGILEEALIARESLIKDGINISIISMHTIKPIDKELILKYCAKTPILITLEEHSITGGLGGAVAEIIADNSIKNLKFKRMGLTEGFSSVVGSQKYLRSRYKIDSVEVVKTIKKLIEDV